jgi:siroheme synthase
VTGTLEDIATRAADLKPPTVLVVGDVVSLRGQPLRHCVNPEVQE